MVPARNLLCLLVLGVTAGVTWPASAFAQDDQDDEESSTGVFDPHGNRPIVDVSVTTTADGVWIEVHGQQSIPGQSIPGGEHDSVTSGTPGTDRSDDPMQQEDVGAGVVSWYDPQRGYFSRTPDGHVYNLRPVNISNAGLSWVQAGFQEHPDSMPMGFYIDGEFQGIVWVPDEANPDNVQWGAPPSVASNTPEETPVVIDPREVALDLLSHIPLPDLRIQANPRLGLVGMPIWFWVDGYGGEPFGDTVTVELPPEAGEVSSFEVEVEVQSSTYEWSFGDGSSLTTNSLGKQYPAESDIQHTYEHSSLPFPDGFTVQLTIEFTAEFRVNGGASQELPPISQTYQSAFRIQEMQPVLTGQ